MMTRRTAQIWKTSAAMLRLAFLSLCLPSALNVNAQEHSDTPTPPLELVMNEGERITATTAQGTITITAGKGLLRSYTWDGATRSAELWGRTKRWYGSFGAYYPGPGDHWESHNGITRGVLEEGQQHFASEAEFHVWRKGTQSYLSHVYTNNGLMVGWSKSTARRQINCNVWQVFIGGKRPEMLEGAQDGKITREEAPKMNNVTTDSQSEQVKSSK